MKYLIKYSLFEGRLETDYMEWFLKNDDGPLINGIRLKIIRFAPDFINEFYYRLTNDESPEEVISEIYKKASIKDQESLDYLNELKRRNNKRRLIDNINRS